MDNDEAGVVGAKKFAAKLGAHRCVNAQPAPGPGGAAPPKDANDALLQGADLGRILAAATKPRHGSLLGFSELRSEVLHELRNPGLYVGAAIPSFPRLHGLLKGARTGELTLLTGPSGAGKTTLASQISLDLLEGGAPTLWGSFEVKNSALAIKMLKQKARDAGGLPRDAALEALCDDFERLPLHFMRFHAATNVDDVVDAMEFAAYVHDVEHVVLDNLQFMTPAGGAGRSFDKWAAQDAAVAKFRDFATRRSVHAIPVAEITSPTRLQCDRIRMFPAVLRELDESNRFVQKSAKTTSI